MHLHVCSSQQLEEEKEQLLQAKEEAKRSKWAANSRL